MAVKHRRVQVKVYRKSAKYPFYRIAYRAEGRRITRSFKTLAAAKAEAKRVAKDISKGTIHARSRVADRACELGVD